MGELSGMTSPLCKTSLASIPWCGEPPQRRWKLADNPHLASVSSRGSPCRVPRHGCARSRTGPARGPLVRGELATRRP
jgi:hypothetical protein